MRARLANESLAARRIALERDIAVFPVAFHTRRRGDDLHHIMGSGLMMLPDHGGFILNFPSGKALRAAVPIRPDSLLPSICPVAILSNSNNFDSAKLCHWNSGRGCLFPHFYLISL